MSTTNHLFPGEDPDIRNEVAAVVVEDSEGWLETPHRFLGWQKPKDLIGTKQEQLLRDLLRAIKQGMPT